MYIVRWLTHHPIVAIWTLTIIALFLSMSGESHKTEIATTDKGKGQSINLVASEHTQSIVSSKDETKVAEKVQVVSATKDSEINSKVEEHNASAEGLDEQSIDDLLLMAREAYWNNGLEEAVTIYQQLIQREPNVVTYKGELGNVYWKQGFPEKSASLYAEIAIPMIQNGEAERVTNMVGFIKLYHPDKATEIDKQLQGLTKN